MNMSHSKRDHSPQLSGFGGMHNSSIGAPTIPHAVTTVANQALNNQGNAANLKGKLFVLEELIRQLNEELNFHKKQVQILKSEKDTLESVLTMKTQDVRKTLTNQLYRVEEEMKRHFAHQKAENSRLQQQITALKGEKTALQQQLLGLQRRISELELQVGADDDQ